MVDLMEAETKPVECLNDLIVLAVEDQSEAMRLLRSMLTDLGINQIYTAQNGKDALEFLDDCEEMINLIICDWNLPQVTGLELLRQIRTADPDIPFLMVTGASDRESVMVAKENGVTGYLAKPYSQNDLEKKLNLVLRVMRAKQANV